MIERNKGYRKFKGLSKWIRRTKYRMLNNEFVLNENKVRIYNPSITECLDSPDSKIYKSTGTPCSCYLCQGNKKYSRKDFKKDTIYEIKNDV